jgi:hypothetical protein
MGEGVAGQWERRTSPFPSGREKSTWEEASFAGSVFSGRMVMGSGRRESR